MLPLSEWISASVTAMESFMGHSIPSEIDLDHRLSSILRGH
jgi:hypothetical protein